MSNPRKTGSFGRVERKKASTSHLVLRILLVGIAVILIPFAYKGWKELYVTFLEKNPPVITVHDLPAGVGIAGTSIKFTVTDDYSGIDEIVIRAEQYGDIKEIYREHVLAVDRLSKQVKIDLPGQAGDFREGELKLVISAFDRSFWANGGQETVTLLVDYTPPRIEVITRQHNVALGGSAVVFYDVRGGGQVFSGVKIGEWLFPGFKAGEFDQSLVRFDSLHVAFFPIPLEFSAERDEVSIFARDVVGNLGTASFGYRVLGRRYGKQTVRLEEDFLQSRVQELKQEFQQKSQARYQAANEKFPEANIINDFVIVNQFYRRFLEEQMIVLFQRPKRTRYWEGNFIRQLGSANRGSFGDERQFQFSGQVIHEDKSTGTELASVLRATVRAANAGSVIFAADLGLYGKTVIVDHGFGLTSLYAHLAEIKVSEGDEIIKGEIIGTVGNTGLAFGNHLIFEIRLHGIPVRPVEWWDRQWINDHIEQKLDYVRRQMGLRTISAN